ncbi:MAG TPA: DUF1653 domain-containing protein [Candidatus Paceibacterota bacterium]|nr:DUF1653 domain-containing protein [Candidatus Paceibacterota bacterium]
MEDLLNQAPRSGFFYHYKHDPNGPVNNYAYEVLGPGHHTEDDCRPEDAFMMSYRPLYESAYVYKLGKLSDLRPLAMWMDTIEKDGKMMPRFRRIEDPKVIQELEAVRDRMYGS